MGRLPKKFDEAYGHARMLRLVMEATEEMSTGNYMSRRQPDPIRLKAELSTAFLDKYDKWVHEKRFGLRRSSTLAELVGDGHAKIVSKLCASDPTPRRAGKPRKNGDARRTNNGWFVVCAPATGEVLAASQMRDPENNAIAKETFQKALKKCPRVNCLIYDRMCTLHKRLRPKAEFRKIKHFAVDKMHARGHSRECLCNPTHIPELKRRVRKLNTQICEQTFSWFRRFAFTFNVMSPLRHRFITLRYLAKHNECISHGDCAYLSPMSRSRKRARSTAYEC